MATIRNVWKVYQTARGWHSSFGTLLLTPAPNADYTVNKFNVSESARHDTKRQAVKYAERGGMTGKNRGEIIYD